jgi:hypothetical protein
MSGKQSTLPSPVPQQPAHNRRSAQQPHQRKRAHPARPNPSAERGASKGPPGRGTGWAWFGSAAGGGGRTGAGRQHAKEAQKAEQHADHPEHQVRRHPHRPLPAEERLQCGALPLLSYGAVAIVRCSCYRAVPLLSCAAMRQHRCIRACNSALQTQPRGGPAPATVHYKCNPGGRRSCADDSAPVVQRCWCVTAHHDALRCNTLYSVAPCLRAGPADQCR